MCVSVCVRACVRVRVRVCDNKLHDIGLLLPYTLSQCSVLKYLCMCIACACA